MVQSIEQRLGRIEVMLERLLLQRQMREYYSVDQAAERLGLACWTVRNRCRVGEIDAQKDGSGQWLIPHAEIERLENNGYRLNERQDERLEP